MNSLSFHTKKPSWKQIISLGQSLFSLPNVDAQCDLILETLGEWFQCKAGLRISNHDFVTHLDRYGEIFEDTTDLLTRIQEANAKNTVVAYTEGNCYQKAIAPLSLNGENLGLILLNRESQTGFQRRELDLLDGFRKQTAAAIHAAYINGIHKISEEKSNRLATIIEISNEISSILVLDELLGIAAEIIHKRLCFPNVIIYTVHQGRKSITVQAVRGVNISGNMINNTALDLEQQTGTIPQVARTGKAMAIIAEPGNVLEHPFARESFHPHAELILPMVWGGEVLGILDILSEQHVPFSADEQEILAALSGNLAIAIRNATLYRSEQWRRKVADSMREVAGLLTADVELEQVLDRILIELEHTLPCDFASIWLLTVDDAPIADEKKLSSLSLAAVHTTWLTGINGEDKSCFSQDELKHLFQDRNISNSWLIEAVNAEKPMIRTPASPYDPLGTVLDFPKDYSSIAAPLRIADHPLGVLALGHHTRGRYGYESQIMSATFASYAAVAIENARLYEAAHDQAWISTVLLQVAEATQSLTTLDELVASMARITPMLIGVNACVIFIWENSINAFIPVSAYGLEQNYQEKIKDLVIYQSDCPSFELLIQTKAPVWLSQVSSDESHEIQLLSDFLLDQNSAALVPMIVHGEIKGAFLIDFSNIAVTVSGDQGIERLEEKFTIIQGIAHQTALAVENLHLLKSQKEEAYVSIALLQVAQAVVSLYDLQETLETIVRITPILTGVKRVIIFLWDETKKLFRLSQSYGISRGDLSLFGSEFQLESFPLLTSVYQNNMLSYHIYSTETETPINWTGILPEEIQIAHLDIFPHEEAASTVNGTNDSRVESFLSQQSSLLLAYPLSVKGDFLGVMITQEAAPINEVISAQSRSRRQEITIGITQQAALAIQNDKLQKEVVERERLERELQLAREIQQTFLPEDLRNYQGWDLDVLWEPAREVGGDFYDIFELPGKRLGLVIADVADKGMPAALFMTLVRTLIRATAREELSPSAVLEIVNDLLVTDTKHGLFITVAYAVLSLETGKIVFANAGHNLPLLVRSGTKEIEILATTGMALGVLEGIHIADLNADLNLGDYLILYTDGITEAFSPDGEMFGESRLREVIQNSQSETAHDLLFAIEEAVQDFIGGQPSSDDITLLTVRRTKD